MKASSEITMRQGFTLLELSLVLVIIGLISGSIVLGRDLIRNAQVRATIAQLDSYNVAANTFKNKYGCIPGDCIKAKEFGLTNQYSALAIYGADGEGNGNGDERLAISRFQPGFDYDALIDNDGSWSAATLGQLDEMYLFWLHLFNAGLIGDAVAPKTRIAGAEWKVWCDLDTAPSPLPGWDYKNAYGITGLHTRTQSAGYFWDDSHAGVTPGDAYSIDLKIDDGLPLEGNTRAFGHVNTGVSAALIRGTCNLSNDTLGPIGADEPYCANSSQYNTQQTAAACDLVIKGQF